MNWEKIVNTYASSDTVELFGELLFNIAFYYLNVRFEKQFVH